MGRLFLCLAMSSPHRRTALISIDLQRSNVGRPLAPHAAADVVQRSTRIADAQRAASSRRPATMTGALSGAAISCSSTVHCEGASSGVARAQSSHA
jgi:hypothetical protein